VKLSPKESYKIAIAEGKVTFFQKHLYIQLLKNIVSEALGNIILPSFYIVCLGILEGTL